MFQTVRFFIVSIGLITLLVGCKSQTLKEAAPFSIDEKSYFHWVGGKEGTQGTTIKLRGHSQSFNIAFSKLYFQNHEYDVVPEFNSNGFVIEGNFSEFREKEMVLDKDPAAEYGNTPSQPAAKIPFDLNDDEAVLQYSVNGREGFYKVTGIKELDKVFMP